jgi:hypothetical protein
MSSVMRDLWPEDIKSEEVISPEEILNHQASRLEARTNGLLVGHVVRHELEDRVVLGFEVEAPRADSRARLFEVQHRLELDYPAAIVPPDEELPDFLKKRVYRPGTGDLNPVKITETLNSLLSMGGKWVENEWVATSPTDFSEKVENLLAHPSVKAIVLSLLSRVSREHHAEGPDGGSPA